MQPPTFFFKDTATTEIYTLSLHDALPISWPPLDRAAAARLARPAAESPAVAHSANRTLPGSAADATGHAPDRSEEHTSELQSRLHLVCRLLLEKKKKQTTHPATPRQESIH